MDCTDCKSKPCQGLEYERLPKGCLTLQYRALIKTKVLPRYKDKIIKKFYSAASEVESEGYMKWPRLKEIIEFCKKTNLRKIGIAYCIGLEREGKTVKNILLKNGFSVFPVVCKVGAIPKKEFDLKSLRGDSSKEAACNPIGQAEILNQKETDLNIIIGLCVGHDILFSKFSKAPITTLVVKDRVLAHNPAGVLYSSYYEKAL